MTIAKAERDKRKNARYRKRARQGKGLFAQVPDLADGQPPLMCRWCAKRLPSVQGRRIHEAVGHIKKGQPMPPEPVVPPPPKPRETTKGLPAVGSERRKKLDRERTAFVDELKKGIPYPDAGRRLGITRTNAYNWAKWAVENGQLSTAEAVVAGPSIGSRMPRDQVAQMKADVATLVGEGHAQQWIADQLGVKRYRVERWVAELKAEGVLATKETILVTDPEPIAYDDLTPEARAILDDPGRFVTEILELYAVPWSTMVLQDLLRYYESDDPEYVVLNAPPGCGKSTIVTYGFTAWVATRERAMGRQLTCSLGHASEGKARWYLYRLQRTFETNRKLIELYGRFRPERTSARWSRDELDVEPLDWSRLTDKEPTFSAQSYEKSQLSGRYRLVIWDDLIDKKNSATLEQREKLQDWWENDAESRLDLESGEHGLMVLSNARYGPEDLSFAVRQQVDVEDIDEATGEPRPIYHHLAFKVHDEARCEVDVSGHVTHRGNWPDHCLLDERRLSWRGLRKARAGQERRWALVYQQEDSDPVGFLAQRVWFEGGTDTRGAISPGCFHPDMRFGMLPPGMAGGDAATAPVMGAVTIDPSSVKYWAVTHYVAWGSGVHQVYRCIRRPLQAPEILYRQDDGTFTGILHDMVTAARDEGVPLGYLIVENNHAQRWIMQYPFFTNYCAAAGISIIPHATNKTNKPDPDRGLEMLGPIYQHGRIWIPTGGHEEKIIAEQFRREACAWPEGQFTDLIMGHWFFTNRMDALLAAETWSSDTGAREDSIPAFVRNRSTHVPAFVTKRLARTG